ncbi:hypothetical protein BC332_11305 [Capsicum chinense]|nr:hypothetical protein BC332_11305 [Capsicum chinense]
MGGDSQILQMEIFYQGDTTHYCSPQWFIRRISCKRNAEPTLSDVVISYLMHSREKVNPTIINNDVRVLMYMMDVDADGFRPILRINVVKSSFKGPLNSLPPPARCSTIDDDLNNYENDNDYPINMEVILCIWNMFHRTHKMRKKTVERDHNQNIPSLTESISIVIKYSLTKKKLKMLLDGATVRKSFNYCMEKSWTKFLKAKCISCGCGWLLQERKYETSNRFYIYKYVWLHKCGVEHSTLRHKRISSELIASLCINHFRDGKGSSIREIQRIVFKEMHYNTSYWMCWKRSVIVKNIIRGTPEHGYAYLMAFSHTIELLNPESSYSIMVNRMDGSFVYYFLAFGAYIWGYADMRKIITIASTHLYGNCTHHGLCMRHLAKNIRVNQHCGENFYLFYSTEKAYSVDEFSEHFVKLKNNCPKAAYVLENVLGFEK